MLAVAYNARMNTSVIGPVFIAGATGMLGLALTSLCDELGLLCHPYSEAQLDITDAGAVDAAIARFAERCGGGGACGGPGAGGPHAVVINAAAYTDVERAEDEEERAFAVNDRGARNLAEAAARLRLGLIHVSTDFVFDGTKSGPYSEQDPPNPLNAYGRSKLAGERSVAAAYPDALVIRTAWVYGPGGNNFPRKILDLARQRDELQVVTDEVGSPTATVDLARGILQLWSLGATGLFHLAGAGSCSRYEMAQEVVETAKAVEATKLVAGAKVGGDAGLADAGLATRLVPVSRSVFPSRVKRPANSVLCLDKSRSLGVEMPPWRDSLRTYVRRYLEGSAA